MAERRGILGISMPFLFSGGLKDADIQLSSAQLSFTRLCRDWREVIILRPGVPQELTALN